MNDLQQFKNLQLQVDLELESLSKRLLELQVADYPSGAGPSLISKLIGAIEGHRVEIDRILADYPVDPVGALSRLRSRHRKISLLPSLLHYLANAETRKVPWSLVPSIERIFKSLMPDRQLLLSAPILAPTYSIRWWLTPTEEYQHFTALEIPAIHRLNALFHILIGHELFHPLVADHLCQVQPAVAQRIRTPCSQYLKSQTANAGPLFQLAELSDVVELVRQIWYKAMEEIMCDMGCVGLFGPAALFASSRFALPFDPDEVPQPENDFYPPWRFRIRAAKEYAFGDPDSGACFANLRTRLEESNLADYAARLENQLASLDSFCASDSDKELIGADPLLKIAYEQVSLELADGWKYINKLVSDRNLSWHLFYEEVPDHVRNLRLHVPSCEVRKEDELIGTPASVSAIAVAGWLIELAEQSRRADLLTAESVEGYLRQCRLIFKSAEDSELKRRVGTDFAQ